MLGTADYVAPEQVANSHSVDIRADIYGLGATLYFMLAGHPPFPVGTVSQKLLWHRTKEPTPIQQLRPEVPDGLAALLARLMAKDPKARFQTPAQVATELELWLAPNIAMPTDGEMPQLSAAAMEGAEEPVEMHAEVAAPAYAGAGMGAPSRTGGSGTVRTATRAATVATQVPRVAASPFSQPAALPWNAPLPDPFNSPPQPLRGPLSAMDTAHAAAEHTPNGSKANPALASNPFSRGDLATQAEKKNSWGNVVAAFGGAAVAGLALAALKFFT